MAAHFSNWKEWPAVAYKQLEEPHERNAAFQRAAHGMQGLQNIINWLKSCSRDNKRFKVEQNVVLRIGILW